MIETQLSEIEWKLAQEVARRRSNRGDQDDVTDMKRGPQSAKKTDLNGAVAELAAAKGLNRYPDIKAADGPKGVDLRYETHDVDVKGTEYLDGKLLVPLWKEYRESAKADIYLLVTIDYDTEPPTCQLVGWEWAEEVYDEDNVVNLGHGPCFGIDQTDLKEID